MTNEPKRDSVDRDDPRYRRAARLLGQKLGIPWRNLPAQQVLDYLRKIELADEQARQKPRP